MATLVHLNGPSGVGKSALGQRFAADHPGVLNLDIDRIVPLIGCWEQDFFAAVGPARRLAIAMAETHLKAGHDVVMPQLVTDTDEAQRFEAAVARAGAVYVEVALIASQAAHRARFHDKTDGSYLDEQIGPLSQSAAGMRCSSASIGISSNTSRSVPWHGTSTPARCRRDVQRPTECPKEVAAWVATPGPRRWSAPFRTTGPPGITDRAASVASWQARAVRPVGACARW